MAEIAVSQRSSEANGGRTELGVRLAAGVAGRQRSERITENTNLRGFWVCLFSDSSDRSPLRGPVARAVFSARPSVTSLLRCVLANSVLFFTGGVPGCPFNASFRTSLDLPSADDSTTAAPTTRQERSDSVSAGARLHGDVGYVRSGRRGREHRHDSCG